MKHPPQRDDRFDAILAVVAFLAAVCLYWLIGRLP